MTRGFLVSLAIAAPIGFYTADFLLAIGCFLILFYTSTQTV